LLRAQKKLQNLPWGIYGIYPRCKTEKISLQRPAAHKPRQQARGRERFLVFLLHFNGNFVFLLSFIRLSPCRPPALFLPTHAQHAQLMSSPPHLPAPTQQYQCIAQKNFCGLAPLNGVPHYSSLFASSEKNY